MYTSSISPAMVSVAMSRSDSRDSTLSTSSTASSYRCGFTPAPQTVSYAASHIAPSMTRTISNTSSTSSSSSLRRASQITQRRDSSTWVPSPYRSCQQTWEEPSSYLSDDDLLWIAPSKQELPVTSIPSTLTRRTEMTTEEQIAMLREQQEKEQEGELVRQQQQRRQAAAAAQRAVRFAPAEAKRRSSSLKKKATPVVRRS